MSKITDVDITELSDGDLLAFDGTKFVSKKINIGPDTFLQKVEVDANGKIVHYVGTGVNDRLVGVEIETYIVRSVGGQLEVGGNLMRTLTFKRGSTYTFNMEDTSLDSNTTIMFSTTSETIGITHYTTNVTRTGTPGDIDATMVLVTDDTTPDTLYYYNSDNATIPPPTGGSIAVSDQEVYTKTEDTFYFDNDTGNVTRGTAPNVGVAYPAWVNSTRDASYIFFDDSIVPRWIEYAGDADLLSDGQNISVPFEIKYTRNI